jgi:aspartate kinase
MIVQNISRDGFTDISFTLPRADRARAEEVLGAVAREIGAPGVVADDRVAKISIVGVGMRSHAGVAARMFETLSAEGINIQMISTSEIAVSCVIEDKYTELAVRALHDVFALGAERGDCPWPPPRAPPSSSVPASPSRSSRCRSPRSSPTGC